MISVELSLADRFVDFGNRFFNVQHFDWKIENELNYEQQSDEPFNQFFVTGENKMNQIYKTINTIMYSIMTFLFPKASMELDMVSVNSVKNSMGNRPEFYSKSILNYSKLNNQVNQPNAMKLKLIDRINMDMKDYILKAKQPNRKVELNRNVSRSKNMFKNQLKNEYEEAIEEQQSSFRIFNRLIDLTFSQKKIGS